jgi:iron transport multicopper oxidase
MIEAPLAVQAQLSPPSSNAIPQSHWDVCETGHVPTQGNAAGNTVDYEDLRGENKSPGRIPEGFTARGIVALVFSCLSAFGGMAVIAWYGLKPIQG